ncbi:MAG: hypothetical protein DMF80_15820 [Acidobacteria bacterium]|nr:MAG: hypothetical protein DMF80_15820 [Acidobacteriota bacterium]
MKLPDFWKTYAVLAVLGGLGAYVYFVESKKEGKPEKSKEKVVSLDKAKVKELSLAGAGKEEVKLVKDGTSWRLTAPQAAPADAQEAESVLSSLEGLEIDEVVSETPGKLSEFGLDPPKTKVTVVQQGGPAQEVLFGNKTPDEGSVYAKQPNRPRVFTVAAYSANTFDKKPFDLRDRDLLHVQRDAVRKLEVTGPDGGYALARDERGEWGFTAPLATRAGRWSVDGLLGNVETLRMESVAAEEPGDLKPYGLDKPARVVRLGLADGNTKTLEIGGATGDKKHYARAGGRSLVAVIPDAIVDELGKGKDALRAKRLLEVSSFDVEGFNVEAGGAKKAYGRTASKDKDGVETSKWKRTVPDGKDLDTTKVQDALFLVGGVEVQEFLDKPAGAETYGLDHPALKVTIREKDKPESFFEVGEKGGAYYARRAGDEAVLKLDATKAADLVKKFSEL